MPVGRKEGDGPEVGGGRFEFESDGECAILRFASSEDSAGNLGSRRGVDQRDVLPFGELGGDFEQTTMRIDDQSKRVHGDELAVVEPGLQ